MFLNKCSCQQILTLTKIDGRTHKNTIFSLSKDCPPNFLPPFRCACCPLTCSTSLNWTEWEKTVCRVWVQRDSVTLMSQSQWMLQWQVTDWPIQECLSRSHTHTNTHSKGMRAVQGKESREECQSTMNCQTVQCTPCPKITFILFYVRIQVKSSEEIKLFKISKFGSVTETFFSLILGTSMFRFCLFKLCICS